MSQSLRQQWLRTALTLAITGLSQQALALSTLDEGSKDSGFYLGGGFGMSNYHVEAVSGLTQKNDDDSNKAAWKSFIGYQFDPTWGVEAGYASLGKMSKDFTAGRYQAKGDALFVSGIAHMLRYNNFSLIGRLTLSSAHLDADKNNPKVAEFSQVTGSRKTSLGIGLGAEYRINQHWSANLDVDNFGQFSKKVNATLISVGATYHF